MMCEIWLSLFMLVLSPRFHSSCCVEVKWPNLPLWIEFTGFSNVDCMKSVCRRLVLVNIQAALSKCKNCSLYHLSNMLILINVVLHTCHGITVFWYRFHYNYLTHFPDFWPHGWCWLLCQTNWSQGRNQNKITVVGYGWPGKIQVRNFNPSAQLDLDKRNYNMINVYWFFVEL